MADILITGGIVVTMDPTRRVIDDGAVAIKADRIVAVGDSATVAAAPAWHPLPAGAAAAAAAACGAAVGWPLLLKVNSNCSMSPRTSSNSGSKCLYLVKKIHLYFISSNV